MPSKLPKRTMHALGCDRTICSTGWPCMAAAAQPTETAEPTRATAGVCRQCGRPRPVGFITCGRSACQEQESRDNAERAALAKRRRRRKP